MWDIIGMSLSHCTGANNGVGLRHGWVCVQLLTPVIAACFDVFFNVVLCCLLMYILIIIKGNLNQPLLVTKVEFFRCSYKCLFEREKQRPFLFYFLYPHLSAYVRSPWLCCPMIHLRVAMKSQRCQRRPTPPCETLPVCSYLKISCPLAAFGPEWRTSDATQQAHQCGNVSVIFQSMRLKRERLSEPGVQKGKHSLPWSIIRWSPSSSGNWKERQRRRKQQLCIPPTPFAPLVIIGSGTSHAV